MIRAQLAIGPDSLAQIGKTGDHLVRTGAHQGAQTRAFPLVAPQDTIGGEDRLGLFATRGDIGLAVNVFSYVNGVRVSVIADEAVVEDPALIIQEYDTEYRRLRRALGLASADPDEARQPSESMTLESMGSSPRSSDASIRPLAGGR